MKGFLLIGFAKCLIFCYHLQNLTIFIFFLPFSTLEYFDQYLSKMQNEKGEVVDLYIPRKCSWTNRILISKDHGAVQINVANVDPETGLATGDSSPFALCGYLRFTAEADMALTELVKKNDAAMSE